MKKWSRKYDRCQNCGSKRFSHKAGGYCKRCYPLVKKLEKVDSWDLSNPQSLKGYPKLALNYRDEDYKRKLFGEIQEGCKSQIQQRLAFLRGREEILAGEIQDLGMIIEMSFIKIASKCGIKDCVRLFHGSAGSIDARFDAEQKRCLFSLLNRIEEHIRWRGINWGKVLSNQTER